MAAHGCPASLGLGQRQFCGQLTNMDKYIHCSTVRCIDMTLTLQYGTVHYMDTDTDIGITVMLAA